MILPVSRYPMVQLFRIGLSRLLFLSMPLTSAAIADASRTEVTS
jgi:hypothetical protein